MGIFGRKGAPTKAGAYKTAWPKSSGLGVLSYMEEEEAQRQYLIYTTGRKAVETVPQEDMTVMSNAEALLRRLPPSARSGEVCLIQGPVDVEWSGSHVPGAYAAEAVLTNHRVIIWWDSIRGRGSGLVIMSHEEMIPRPEVAARLPYVWQSVQVTDYPIKDAGATTTDYNAAFIIGVHFSSDPHANRRSMSVQATMNEIERRRTLGQAI